MRGQSVQFNTKLNNQITYTSISPPLHILPHLFEVVIRGIGLTQHARVEFPEDCSIILFLPTDHDYYYFGLVGGNVAVKMLIKRIQLVVEGTSLHMPPKE